MCFLKGAATFAAEPMPDYRGIACGKRGHRFLESNRARDMLSALPKVDEEVQRILYAIREGVSGLTNECTKRNSRRDTHSHNSISNYQGQTVLFNRKTSEVAVETFCHPFVGTRVNESNKRGAACTIGKSSFSRKS